MAHRIHREFTCQTCGTVRTGLYAVARKYCDVKCKWRAQKRLQRTARALARQKYPLMDAMRAEATPGVCAFCEATPMPVGSRSPCSDPECTRLYNKIWYLERRLRERQADDARPTT